MAWRRPGDKPISEPIMVSLLTHICVTRPQWVKQHASYCSKWLSWYPFKLTHNNMSTRTNCQGHTSSFVLWDTYKNKWNNTNWYLWLAYKCGVNLWQLPNYADGIHNHLLNVIARGPGWPWRTITVPHPHPHPTKDTHELPPSPHVPQIVV